VTEARSEGPLGGCKPIPGVDFDNTESIYENLVNTNRTYRSIDLSRSRPGAGRDASPRSGQLRFVAELGFRVRPHPPGPGRMFRRASRSSLTASARRFRGSPFREPHLSAEPGSAFERWIAAFTFSGMTFAAAACTLFFSDPATTWSSPAINAS